MENISYSAKSSIIKKSSVFVYSSNIYGDVISSPGDKISSCLQNALWTTTYIANDSKFVFKCCTFAHGKYFVPFNTICEDVSHDLDINKQLDNYR